MNGLTTGQLAKAANVGIETIRYYEQRGLISPFTRTNSGYRLYAAGTADEIRWIKRAQAIGFSLEEIKVLAALYRGTETYPHNEIFAYAKSKVIEVEQQIQTLMHFKALLQQVTQYNDSELPFDRKDCPVLTTIFKEDAV